MAKASGLNAARGMWLERQDIEQIGELEHALHGRRPGDESELASIPVTQFLRKEHHPKASAEFLAVEMRRGLSAS